MFVDKLLVKIMVNDKRLRVKRHMKRLFSSISLIFFMVLVSGCVAGAFVAGGAAGGAVAGDNRSFETIADDNKISYLVGQHIAADTVLSNQAHIVVGVYNHVVLLAGQAPTQELRQQAVQDAKVVPNIQRIFNEITLEKPTNAMRQSKDAAITANIKARMLTTTNLRSNQFKIITENATVFLMGLSTRKQSDIAAQVIRNSTGVKRVVRLVEYVSPEGNS